MAKKQGTQTEAILTQGSVWNTAVAGSTGLYVKTPADVVPARDVITDEAVGQPFSDHIDYGNTPAITDDIGGDMYYEGWLKAIANSMGVAGTPTDNSDGSYQHDLTLADSIDGKFCSYAARRGTDIFEYPSIKINGFEITGEAGGPVEMSLKNMRDRLIGPGESSSQTFATSDFTSIAYADKVNRVMTNQGVFRMNAQGDGALGSTSIFGAADVICPASFTFSFNRPMEGDFCMDGNNYIVEPTATDVGNRETTFSITFPQYDTVRDKEYIERYLEDAVNNRYPLKGDFAFTGATIAGVNAYLFKVEMPHLVFESVDSVTPGVGKIPSTYNFKVLGASAAPTGMTALTNPYRVTAVNTRSTDPLA